MKNPDGQRETSYLSGVKQYMLLPTYSKSCCKLVVKLWVKYFITLY